MKISLKSGLIFLNIAVFLSSFFREDTLFHPEYVISLKQVFLYIFIKIMLASLLFIECFVIMTVVTNINETITREFLKYFCVLGLIYAFLFSVVHPGIFNYDVLGLVGLLRVYGLDGVGQGLLTYCFMGAILSVVPNPSAIVIVQLIIIVAIQAYVAALIKNYSGKQYIANLVVIADVLPLNIIVNMFPLRMSIYGHFCELLMVFLWEQCFIKRNQTSTIRKMLLIGVFSGCIASWRFDTIFAVLFGGIFLLIFKQRDWKRHLIACITSVSVYCAISLSTNALIPVPTLRQDIGKAMCTTLSVMSQEDLGGGGIAKWLRDVDKVIDIDIVRGHPSLWSPKAFYYDAWRDPSGPETVNGLMAYLKIVVNNLPNYMKVKWQQFDAISASDFYGYDEINESDIENGFAASVRGSFFEGEAELYHMHGDGIRTYFLKWLYNPTGIEVIDNMLLGVNLAVAIIIIVFCIAIFQNKRFKQILALSLFPIFHFVILMSGMAMPWPMYFGSIILEGCMVGIILLSTIVIEKQKLIKQ